MTSDNISVSFANYKHRRDHCNFLIEGASLHAFNTIYKWQWPCIKNPREIVNFAQHESLDSYGTPSFFMLAWWFILRHSSSAS